MSPSHPTVLSAIQTRSCLPWPSLMQAIALAAQDLKHGKIQAPARQAVPFPHGGMLLSMPATAADIGVHKLVNVVASNRERQLPTIHGLVAVYDGQTGQLQLLLDGPTVTTCRTVAVSMLGVSRLLPDGPRHAAVFGAGTQANGHIRALRDLYPTCRIDIIGRTLAKTKLLAQSLDHPTIQAATEVAETVDLVITATTSTGLVYQQPAQTGRMVIAVGAYRADLAEISPDTINNSQLFVDDLEGARHEAGDFLQAHVDWSRVQDLTALLDSPAPSGPCVFKTVGCAAWDLAAARCALTHQSLINLDSLS